MNLARTPPFGQLVISIEKAHQHFALQASKAVNVGLTQRNWVIGHYIAEFELRGQSRALYGEKLLSELSKRLSALKVSNCNKRQLYRYLRFSQLYPQIVETLSPQFKSLLPTITQSLSSIVGTASPQLAIPAEPLISQLSYSHLELVIEFDDPLKRDKIKKAGLPQSR